GDLHLSSLVVEVEERESRGAAEAHHGVADVELSARVLIRPELVAERQRAVAHGVSPTVGTRRLERYAALGIAQLRNPAGRIGSLIRILSELLDHLGLIPRWLVLRERRAAGADEDQHSCGNAAEDR